VTSIAIIGNIQADVVVRPVTSLPPPGADRRVDGIAVRAGGPAATAARTVRAAGAQVRLYGSVGDDAWGRVVHDELAAHGLERDLVVEPGQRTGVSVCLDAPARDRSSLTQPGTMGTYRAEQVPAAALDADLFLLCGYFRLPAIRGEPTRRLLAEAARRGALTLFDTGWDTDGWDPATLAELDPVLAAAGVFLPGADEVCGVAGEPNPYRATRMVQRRHGGWVVTKLGADGCCAAGPDGAWYEVGAPTVRTVGTTGYGDAFNAGLLLALAGGTPWPDALAAAVRSRRPRVVPGAGGPVALRPAGYRPMS
jgi:sugar/nucleoside kinase (ribokinase family)